jgi:hypothetical protein
MLSRNPNYHGATPSPTERRLAKMTAVAAPKAPEPKPVAPVVDAPQDETPDAPEVEGTEEAPAEE